MDLSNRRRRSWWSIVVVAVLLLALPLGIVLYRTYIAVRSSAGNDRPADVVVSNITSEAAVISWISNPDPVIGSVKYSLNQAEVDTASARLAQDDRDIKQSNQTKARLTHYISLTSLLPGKTYYFRLISGNAIYPATSQAPLQFTTLASGIAKVGSPITAYGEVSNTDDASKDTIIYATLKNDGQSSTPVSTVVTDSRTWFIDLTNALENDRTAYFTLNDKTTISILGQAGTKGIKVETTVEFVKSNPLVLNLEDGYPVAQYLPDNSKFPDPGDGTTTTVTPTSSGGGGVSGSSRQDAPLEAARLVSNQPVEVTLPIPYGQILVSNLTDTSFTVVASAKEAFTTRACTGDACAKEDGSDPGEDPSLLLHHITLTNLTASTPYTVTLDNYDPSQITVTTVAASDAPPSPVNISGKLTGAKGTCVVLIQLQRGSETSSLITRQTDSDFSWQANIGAARQSTGGALFQPQDSDQVIIQAQCAAGNSVYTGKTQTTVAEAQQNKTNLKVTNVASQTPQVSSNNIYAPGTIDAGYGIGGGPTNLPDAATWSPIAVWLLSLGGVCLAVGAGLIALYLHNSRRNRWEEDILKSI